MILTPRLIPLTLAALCGPLWACGDDPPRQLGLHARPEIFRWGGAETSETEQVRADELPGLARRFYRSFYLRPEYIAGRLASRRGLESIMSHARLGMRMARYVAEPYLPWL